MKVFKDIDVRYPTHITFEHGDFQLIQNNAQPLQKLNEKNSLQVIEESGVSSHPDSCTLDMYKNVDSLSKKDLTQLCFHGWSRKLPLKMEASLLLYTASSTKLQIIIIVKIL